MFLLLYWAGLSLTAVLLVLVYNKKHWQVTTVDRKYFHMISVMIFVPGLIYDPEFTKLASVLAFLIFILVEVCEIIYTHKDCHALLGSPPGE